MQRVWLSILALAVLAVGATACGKKTSKNVSERALESAMRTNGQDVTVKSDNVQIKTKDADVSLGEGAKLPDQWPNDVPVYKGLKLLSAMKTKDAFSIQGTTTDSRDKVAAFYKDQAVKGGWIEETVMTQPQMAMLNYAKEKRKLAVVVTSQESETSVSITVTSE